MPMALEQGTSDVMLLLRGVPFLSDLEPLVLRDVSRVCERIHLPKGTEIFAEGDVGDSMYIVASGEVKIYKHDKLGQPMWLDTNGPGDVFGELALVTDQCRAGSAITTCDSTLVVMSKGQLMKLIDGQSARLFNVIGLIARRLLDHDARVIEELRATNQELREANEKINHSYLATLISLNNALDLRDSATLGHSQRVVAYTLRLGRALGLGEHALTVLEHGAQLHDIGKIGVPDAILNKPGPLNEAEWRVMHKHPVWGAQILADVPFLGDATDIVLAHHERWDGTGYPRGLSGTDIPLGARIFTVADVFDALISDRPYKRAMSTDKAYGIIIDSAGTQFDPAIVAVFTTIFDDILRDMQRYSPDKLTHDSSAQLTVTARLTAQ